MEFGTTEHEELVRKRATRQAGTTIRRWSHIASRVRDLEATRHFYEDLLGLPLVTAHSALVDPEAPDVPTNYMHAFFELGDGTCIAFFQFAPGLREDPVEHPTDPYERHLAMQIDTMEQIEELKQRLTASNWPWRVIDHGAFYSLYVNDPDGDTIELTYHRAIVDLVYCQDNPHQKLREWLEEAKAQPVQ